MSSGRRERLDHRSLFDREIGGVKKKWKDRLPVAIIFPNTYQLGMSNLGFQIVLSLLNQHPDIVCERFFSTGAESPLSVESNRPLKDFPVIIFSVSFEYDFVSVVDLLRRGGIAPTAVERRQAGGVKAGTPLVIGGGVATFINPEPLAPFMDLFVLGEIEPVAAQLLDYLFAVTAGRPVDACLLDMAINLPGCYVPSLYHPHYGDDGRLESVEVVSGVPPKIAKNVHAGGAVAGHSHILTEETEFANIHLVELGRGCSRSCRFCAAGYVYRPPRLWEPSAIMAAIEARPDGNQRVGLLGMEMASPDDLQSISNFLLDQSCSLSFSSLRADAIGGPLLDLLSKSGLKTAVIAPDGGSERLRRVINKGITRADCLQAASLLAEAGIFTLKLYFMIGLPTETMEDLDEMVDLVLEIQDTVMAVGRPRGRICRLALSVNSFVPKAWTPFQFAEFGPVEVLKERIKFLRKRFAGCHHLTFTADQPDNAYFQAMLARGDRRVGEALFALSEQGRNWRQVCRQAGIDPDFYAARSRDQQELLPWEVVDHGIDRAYLWHEYQQALRAKPSPVCGISADNQCRRCGVCRD
ncbi:MAG: radical SAM protein [Proteobacteria bacterium]|nr:radical SAM protein [Desulfobulbaceae bacterium]MBU4151565.1 radical SAM protein [Pseudomonadota bacterium]MDP2107404.1 radical SAM protein [Desulfobulbaceae bacterium]